MKQLLSHWKTVTYKMQDSQALTAKQTTGALVFIILIIVIVRLLTIQTPSLQWTAWKEIDYITISTNYWKNGFNFLQPEVSWPAEPPRVTEMELPLVPFVTAILYQIIGYSAFSSRAVTLFASILVMVYVFKLVKRELNPFTALLASLAAGILPLYHPFGRLLFTEPSMIAMSVASLYYVAEWVEYERKRDKILATLALSLTFSLKLETLYLLLPIAWIAFRKYQWKPKQYKDLATILLIAFILPVIWYAYAYYLENTGAHLFGIFKGHNKSQTLTMLSDLRWYRTMAGRIINGILGGAVGFLLFILGITVMTWVRKGGLFFAYLISVGVYFILVAEGNVDAPYRQLPIVPVMAVFVAFGAQSAIALIAALFELLRGNLPKWMLVSASIIPILVIPIQSVADIVSTDAPAHWDRWVLAEEIHKVTYEQDKLVVVGEYSKHVGGYDLSPVLYYYSGRQGWTLTPDEWTMEYVEGLRNKGATLFVATLPYGYPYDFVYLPEISADSFIAEMKLKYPVLYEEDAGLILDLR